jgi:cytochrome c-type biogenesis protein CcmH
VVQERGVATSGDNDPAIKELERRLKCTCGCNLDIYTCRTTDFTCTYSPALHREVLALRGEGKSADGVLAAFTAKYGEQILMAPRPAGFNLAGYLVPGVLITLAGATLAAVLVRRSRRIAALSAASEGGSSALAADPAGQERLRRALADVED